MARDKTNTSCFYSYNRANYRLHEGSERKEIVGRVYLPEMVRRNSEDPEAASRQTDERCGIRRDTRKFLSIPSPPAFSARKLVSKYSDLKDNAPQPLSVQNGQRFSSTSNVSGFSRARGDSVMAKERPRFGRGDISCVVAPLNGTTLKPSELSSREAVGRVPAARQQKFCIAAATGGRGDVVVPDHSFVKEGSSTTGKRSFFGRSFVRRHASMPSDVLPVPVVSKAIRIDETYPFWSTGMRFRNSYRVGETINIYVSFVLDPRFVFVVHDVDDDLPEMLGLLSKAMRKMCPCMPVLEGLPPLNAVVAVLSKRYNGWFRAQVLEHVSERSVYALFVDYGNSEVISLESVRSVNGDWFCIPLSTLPVELVDLPDEGYFSEQEIKATEKFLLNKFGTLLITEVRANDFAGELFINSEPESENGV